MKPPRLPSPEQPRPGASVPIRNGPHRDAFTLIEVILAISIATGILVTALGFYRQAAELRNQLLVATGQVSAVRQILDQLALDLRTAAPQSALPFRGTSDSVEFARAVFALPTRHRRSSLSVLTDLRRIAYHTTIDQTGTNSVITGISREESPLLPELLSAADSSGDPRSPDPLSIEGATANNSTNEVAEPLTDAIRFLQFQFWDGNAWHDSWSATNPPRGLEVTVGLDPLPSDMTPQNYPFEKFRRVIFLPTGSTAKATSVETLRDRGDPQ